MTYDFNSILPQSSDAKHGIATYIQYKLAQIWPNLYGLSLLTLGQTTTLTPETIWYPSYHIHGQLNTNNPILYNAMSISKQQACCFLIESFPFQECSFDRIVYIYDDFITKDQFEQLLRSCWKTLDDSGKIIMLLPNKLGWWSLIDNLSLRYRNTFLMQKLNRILTQHLFRISHYERVLYFPPKLMNNMSLRSNRILEFLGLFFVPFLGGYHLIEIEKNLCAPITVAPLKKKYILQSELSKSSWNRKHSS
ncbi:hypothetical protein [Commensalibacter oyaizuii]|uniref:Uncharacterized protein n=1 Tax=Commensalibacter oyaizuii TaxID=3043873 RepID=A0ABT6Q0G1_9PROT|nr:hypothetical protein [Commensalibacter sp. TBRC 16381]MDI2090607.1 hypothetical protein [Commensalibacter sp. TBRC 16381]